MHHWNIFLSQVEVDMLSLLLGNTKSYSVSKEEWEPIRGLAEHSSIFIKPADKGSCVTVLYCIDYLTKAENYLSDNITYKEINFVEKELIKLVEESTKMFKKLPSKQYFRFEL